MTLAEETHGLGFAVGTATNQDPRKRPASGDRIAVVSFSMPARKVRTEEIPFLHWDEMNPYTNMEQALDVARKTLTIHRGHRQQIFLITDGEPTAHHERGNVFFQFPPHPTTLQRTLRAAQSLARQKIALRVFLLSQEKSPVRIGQ